MSNPLPAVGLIETDFLSITLLVADWIAHRTPAAFEGIDSAGDRQMTIRVSGRAGDVKSALEAAETYGETLGARVGAVFLPRPSEGFEGMIHYPAEVNAILENRDQWLPTDDAKDKDQTMSQNQHAIGIIETQGLTAILEAADVMLKAADVRVIGKEKIGGAYVTLVVKGDVAAVKAAVDAGRDAIEELNMGNLIAAHVIARPHEDMTALLPA